MGTLAATAAASLLGCSAHSSAGLTPSTRIPAARATARPGSEPVSRIAIAQRHEVGAPNERRAADALEVLETHFAAGQAALLAGDDDAAFEAFDLAVDSVLTSDLDLEAHPDLRERTEEVMAAIHDLATEVAAEAAAAESAPGVPTLDDSQDGNVIAATSVNTKMWSGDFTIPMVSHPAIDSMVRFYSTRVKDR